MSPAAWVSPGALGWTLAWRYCRRRSIAWLALVGAVLAVTVGFVPAPVMDGFLVLMREQLRATAADVSVDLLGLPDDPAVRAQVAERLAAVPGVQAVAPRADGLVGLTTLDRRQAIAGAQVAGIDLAAEERVTPIRDALLATPSTTRPFALIDPDHPFECTAPVRAFDLQWRRAAYDAAVAAHGAEFQAVVDAAATRQLTEVFGDADLADDADWVEARQAAWMALGELELVKRPYEVRMAAVQAADPAAAGAYWDRAAAAATLETEWERAANAHREATGSDLLPGIVVGEELLRRWPRIRLGAVIELYTANLEGSGSRRADGKVRPTSRAFVVTGVFSTGFYEWDERWCYTDYETARAFFVGSRIAQSWVCKAPSASEAEAVAKAAREAVLDLIPVPPEHSGPPQVYRNARCEVRTWQSGKRTFLKAVESQKGAISGILTIGIVIAGIGILVTLWVLVSEKTRDIGILSAMGAGPGELIRVFVGTGMLLGFIGGVLGVGVGSLILANADAIVNFAASVGFDALDEYVHQVQHLRAIPVAWRPASAISTVVWMVLVSGLFSVIPALRAAWLDPVAAIRRG